MGVITVVNISANDAQVKVAIDDGDKGSNGWFTLKAHGGTETWNRNKNQVISYVTDVRPGTSVQIVLGVVGAVVQIK